jgi:DNA-binding CsgD family transcriptional regulator
MGSSPHARGSSRPPGAQLLGRQREREVLGRLLGAALGGGGGVLVVHGEPGVGKTAVLEWTVEEGRQFRVLRTFGVEGEMELPFAALQQLCSPILERSELLPDPQRDALSVAFGLSAGQAPNPFLVGLAALGLLSEASDERALLCVVDDAQWLDRESARALAFVARRLLAERIALVFAARELGSALAGLPDLHLEPLGHRDARTLLESVLPARLDERVLDRIVLETHGNPLALLELPRGLTPTQLAGGFGLHAAVPLSASIEESFTRRLAVLPGDARRLLLVAAADPTGDTALVWRAARQLGIPESAVQAVEAEDLLELGARVVFRHPLVRSAVYRAAGLKDRRAAHQALAQATDPELDPDRRAWHRAQAASMPDEDVAAELERSAGRAQARGGLAAAAAFLQRSVALTREPARRAERALAAAQASLQAGAFDAAFGMLDAAEAGDLDEFQRARVDLVHAQLAFAVNRGSDAPPLLLKAAKQLASLDARLARETYLEAVFAALFAGRLGNGGGVRETAEAARAAPPSPRPPLAADLLLDAYALTITEGYAVGAPMLQRAVRAFRSEDIDAEEVLRWAFLASYAAQALWDEESYRELPTRQIELAREAGALAVLPMSLTFRMGAHLHAGELGAAESLLEDLDLVTNATGTQLPPYAAIALASWRGREADARELMEVSMDAINARGEGIGVTFIEWTTAVLYNGLGRYEDALAAARPASERREELQSPLWLHELVEAAARSGNRELAADALEELSGMTRIIGTDWALGIEARSRALLSENAIAERLYGEAISRLERTEARVELARAHLLYGEWLRRGHRGVDAREQLRAALEAFTAMGTEAFAQRAERELLATGERARKRTVDTRDQLTPQETQIARLAATGHTNREIAAQLFISPSTVEYHLRKAFRKLDVKSRTQLAHRMS